MPSDSGSADKKTQKPGKTQKIRLDLLLVEKGLLRSRQEAQTAIMDGGILVAGEKVTKPGTPVPEDALLELVGKWAGERFVGRGALKLSKALDHFSVDAKGRICLDIGASTGGFTDCLLRRGASRVYACDVGYGQLDWSLRQDPRVVVRERLNARFATPELVYEDGAPMADLCVIDVSFISLAKILPALMGIVCRPRLDLISLVKPQFEAGKEQVGKGGVVRDADVHAQVIASVIACARKLGLAERALTWSPVKGPAGNIEFLLHLVDDSRGEPSTIDVNSVVARARAELSGH